MKKKWFLRIIRKRMFILGLLILQIILLVYTVATRSAVSHITNDMLSLLSLAVCIYIAAKPGKTAFKLIWIFMIMVFPLFGGMFYLIFRFQKLPEKYLANSDKQTEKRKNVLNKDNSFVNAAEEYPQSKKQISYLQNRAGFPVFDETETEYLPLGEIFFSKLKEELEKAEKFIFLEYFIIQEGSMWNEILEILKKKAASGVKVRVIYDDMGCFVLLPKDYPKQLKKFSIECVAFNPFRPVLATLQNNRDHRKIAVIDGMTAFTGGINLADEYINEYQKFGHWKDCGIMLKGKGVRSLTAMFLQMWNISENTNEDHEEYLPENGVYKNAKGFVQPFSDSPLDNENVGEQVYLHTIYNAKDYVYINTPYFIVDETLLSALCLAAKSGVDVRIVTPGIWDKRLVHLTTRSYYKELTEAGVKVYEYQKGFIHSKTFVTDDVSAVIGTINLDYRSLYHHFECGVCLYGTKAVMQLKEDYLKTLEYCRSITTDDCKTNFITKLFQTVLRLFAPLL